MCQVPLNNFPTIPEDPKTLYVYCYVPTKAQHLKEQIELFEHAKLIPSCVQEADHFACLLLHLRSQDNVGLRLPPRKRPRK